MSKLNAQCNHGKEKYWFDYCCKKVTENCHLKKALKGRTNSAQCEALGEKASYFGGGLKA